MTDTRRVKDVRARPRSPAPGPVHDEAYADAQLAAIGYAGDAKTYRLRLDAIAALEREGLGPGAAHARFFASIGYRSTWTPYLDPETP